MNSKFFTQAEVFVAVARNGSITDAAAELRMSKSNASQKLSEMEKDLDLKLFHRSTRHVALTSAGKKLFDQCAQAVDAISMVHTEFGNPHQKGKDIAGVVTVAGSNIYLTEYLLPIMHPFFEHYPNVKVNLVGSDRPVDPQEDNIDLRIRVGDVAADGVRIFPLNPIPRLLCIGSSAGLKPNNITHPKHLADIPIILREQENPSWQFRKQSKDWIFKTAKPHMLVNSYELCVQAVRNGYGAAILAEDIVRQDISEGLIIPLLSDWDIANLNVSLVARYSRLRRPHVRAFAKHVEQHLKSF